MRFVLSLLLCASPALAHDHWIRAQNLTDPLSGESCCNVNDCVPVLPGGVQEVSGGYLLVGTGEFVPSARVIWKSPDGLWIRCQYMAGTNIGKTRCLIGPPPSN